MYLFGCAQVLVVAHGIFSCGMQILIFGPLCHVGGFPW